MATRKGKPQQDATKGAATAAATKRTPAEYAAYSRGFEEGRRAGIKHERERHADRGWLLRLPEVLRLTGLSRATLWRLEHAGLFPPRVQITANTVGWFEGELVAWKAELPRQDEKDLIAALSDEERERMRRGEFAFFRAFAPTAPGRRPRRSGK